MVSLRDLSVQPLHAAISEVSTNPVYCELTLRLQHAIREADALNYAADVVEMVINTAERSYEESPKPEFVYRRGNSLAKLQSKPILQRDRVRDDLGRKPWRLTTLVQAGRYSSIVPVYS
jgi:hypothetical protein